MNTLISFFYTSISLVFTIGILLSFYDYSYSGYYTDKIISWIWLIFTLVIIVRFWQKRIVKLCSALLLFFLSLSILPMGIPFFGIVYYFSTIDDYQQKKLTETYRIERTRQNALATQRIYIYQKHGILEHNICRPIYKEIVAKVLDSDTITNTALPIQNCKLIAVNDNEIKIEYQVLAKKGIVVHKLKNNDGY